jgi:hypothetical protein
VAAAGSLSTVRRVLMDTGCDLLRDLDLESILGRRRGERRKPRD